jgi:hypothetical protein
MSSLEVGMSAVREAVQKVETRQRRMIFAQSGAVAPCDHPWILRQNERPQQPSLTAQSTESSFRHRKISRPFAHSLRGCRGFVTRAHDCHPAFKKRSLELSAH